VPQFLAGTALGAELNEEIKRYGINTQRAARVNVSVTRSKYTLALRPGIKLRGNDGLNRQYLR
jgi:hypothetical protein